MSGAQANAFSGGAVPAQHGAVAHAVNTANVLLSKALWFERNRYVGKSADHCSVPRPWRNGARRMWCARLTGAAAGSGSRPTEIGERRFRPG